MSTTAAAGVVLIHPDDDVVIAIRALEAGETVQAPDGPLTVRENIPAGHKVARHAKASGAAVQKYGMPIGALTDAVERGAWIHAHNLRTRLSGTEEYVWTAGAVATPASAPAMPTFLGYRRADGRVGTRNEVWIVNTVGCVNTAAERVARVASERYAGMIDGVFAFAHPYGCSQLGDDLQHTRRILAGLMRHPNAGGVLVLGLGCENNQMTPLLDEAGVADPERLRYFNTQDVMDEVEAGVEAVGELVARMLTDRRTTEPASALVLGHKCGGSDGLSGVTANPLLGRIADRLTAMGGRVLLTEVPEMFGAEQLLMARCTSEQTFDALVHMVNDFKSYFIRHGQPIYENPSPGNKDGGLTTLEEKSLGAIQKGGRAVVTDVLRYGDPVRRAGLSLLEAPGNDGVSSTAMVASGATLLLFTTGRGTPLGFPVPTLKVSSNSDIAARKPHWIDVDAGSIAGGADIEIMADQLMQVILDTASGIQQARNEQHGYREIAIWKAGVTL